MESPQRIQLPDELINAIQTIYEPAGIKVTDTVQREAEGLSYQACRLGLNGQTVVFRLAKTTPTKIGQFVTIWKRPVADSAIVPLDISDNIAFVVISVCDANHQGQFVFSQKLLTEKGIMSCNGRGGKLAIRVYPPWTKPVAKAAIRTQQWQLQYFFPLLDNGTADSKLVQTLFSC